MQPSKEVKEYVESGSSVGYWILGGRYVVFGAGG
jgi:hypothetical protein